MVYRMDQVPCAPRRNDAGDLAHDMDQHELAYSPVKVLHSGAKVGKTIGKTIGKGWFKKGFDGIYPSKSRI